ncbi:MAG: phosphoenolpyruvate carboxylase [Verrucomicrobiales bacterium]
MPDDIKNSAYFEEGFRELDEKIAEATQILAKSLPLNDTLRSLVPWRGNDDRLPAIPEGEEAHAAQVLSISFELLNIVEERVAWNFRGKRRAQHGAAAIKGLWPSVIERFKKDGLSEDDAIAALKKISIEPVLTAHPTEAKRPSVREKHLNIYETLRTYESARQDPHYGRRIEDTLSAEFESLWHTGEIFVQRPDIHDELRNALHYLREVFPAVVLRLDRSLELAWEDAGWDIARLRDEEAYPRLRFATWIGGDRDGHPFVTPEVTARTLGELRSQATALHRGFLRDAADQLTLAPPFAKISPEFLAGIHALAEKLGENGQRIVKRNKNEPWRAWLYLLREKFDHADPEIRYETTEDYLADLRLTHESLLAAGSPRAAHEWIHPLLRLARIFGLHLAAIDIRNNSEAHDQAAVEILSAASVPDAENFPEWSEEKRREFLVAELKNPRPLLARYIRAGEKSNNILDYLRLVATHLRKHGPDGLGQLIISMTRSVSDLLLMQVLAREAGLAQIQDNGLWRSRLPVSPLFETGGDLAASPAILSEYLAIMGPHPSGLQPAMVGYSDSNKDAGVFASQWGIFKGQEAMTKACREAGVTPQFFHGRGGTIGRGAGPTQWFLRALPQGSLAGPVRITEQGEVLPRKYAHEGNAHYHLELLIAGVSRIVGVKPDHRDLVDSCRAAFDTLEQHSTAAYRSLLESENFIDFHRSATPIDALETGVFGSRPSRRTGKKASLKDLRAIPWVFSWTQARFYLPGWYGVGSGLDSLGSEDYARIEDALPGLPFLQYVLTNIESSLASANLPLMEKYAALCPDEALRERLLQKIFAEFDLTRRKVGELLGKDFTERRPRMQKTLALREEPLLALHEQQIKLLQRWREADKPIETDGKFHKTFLALQLTINAISSGLRETG